MTFKDEQDNSEDIFGLKLMEWAENRSNMEDYGIFEVDENVLKSLSEREVIKSFNSIKFGYFAYF